MPKFLDHHAKMPQLPPEAMQQQMQMMQQMQDDIKNGRADQFGVTPVNVFMGVNGEAWCLTEAANADAVIEAHSARGATLTHGDIVEVTSLA